MVFIDHTIDPPLDASEAALASPGQQIVSAPCISVQFELDVSMSPGQGITVSPGAVRQSFDVRNLLRSLGRILLRILLLLRRIPLLLQLVPLPIIRRCRAGARLAPDLWPWRRRASSSNRSGKSYHSLIYLNPKAS